MAGNPESGWLNTKGAYMSYFRFPRYVSVAEKRAKAEKKIKQLRKKNPGIQPVWVEGRAMAKTWWGKAWNENLERYADFENRIGRGRSYLRHRAVLDLRIEPGRVRALVQGSASRPYSVGIRIRPLARKNWAAIKNAGAGRIDSMHDLLKGRFPESLSDLFTAKGQGLFPSPKEIEFDCSCPDWADMCKHVAATLYGIGARLDEDPTLFFRLRKANVEDLVSEAVAETTGQLLEKAKTKTDQVIDDADLGDVFGIVMEDQLDFGSVKSPVSKKSKPAKKKAMAGKRTPKKTAPKKTASRKIAPEKTGVAVSGKRKTTGNRQRVLDLVEKAPGGIDVPTLAAKTGLSPARIRPIVYNACKNGLIEKAGRGIFRRLSPRTSPAQACGMVLATIGAAKNGVRVADIQAQTNLPATRVRNAVARIHAQGLIARLSRGVYGPKKKRAARGTASDAVLNIIRRYKKGIGFSQLKEKTGMEERTLRNTVFRLSKQGKIKPVRRGVYMASK
jgi:uncharacterized Zn finger protein